MVEKIKNIKDKIALKYKVLFVASLFLVSSAGMSAGMSIAKQQAENYYTQALAAFQEKFTIVVTETKIVSVDQVKLKDLVEHYSFKHGINPIVTWAIIERESNTRGDRLRFEQGWKNQYASKWPRERWMTDIEYDMLFTSVGYMQVGYGLWKKECNLESYTDLLSAEKNLDCGLSIISTCLKNNKDEPRTGTRIRQCLRRYNGSGELAEKYASELMLRLEDYLVLDEKMNHSKTYMVQP